MNEVRDKKVYIRLTEDELVKLQNKAGALNIPLSTYIRYVSLNAQVEAVA